MDALKDHGGLQPIKGRKRISQEMQQPTMGDHDRLNQYHIESPPVLVDKVVRHEVKAVSK